MKYPSKILITLTMIPHTTHLQPTQQKPDISTESEDETDDDSEAETDCPWCTICNDDATLKCERCKELFCKACFKEMHREDPSIAHHKAVAFKRPKH